MTKATTAPAAEVFEGKIVEIREDGTPIAALEDGRMIPITNKTNALKVGDDVKLHSLKHDPGGAPLNPNIK